MTDFYDIGLKVDCPEDLVTFAQTHADKADFFSDENGSFGLMKPDEETELWFYGDENGVNPCSMEMYAAGGRDIGVTDVNGPITRRTGAIPGSSVCVSVWEKRRFR